MIANSIGTAENSTKKLTYGKYNMGKLTDTRELFSNLLILEFPTVFPFVVLKYAV